MRELDKIFGTATQGKRPLSEQDVEDAKKRRDLNMSPQEPMPDEDDMEEGEDDDEDINSIKDPYAR